MRRISATQAMRDFVLPALDALTEPDEVTSVSVQVNSHGEVWVSVVFVEEPLETQIWAPQEDPSDSFQGLGKFASDLQDHIAESRYAWGTLRTYPEKWNG